MDLTSKEEGGERLVGATPPAEGVGAGSYLGMETEFFLAVIAATGRKGEIYYNF